MKWLIRLTHLPLAVRHSFSRRDSTRTCAHAMRYIYAARRRVHRFLANAQLQTRSHSIRHYYTQTRSALVSRHMRAYDGVVCVGTRDIRVCLGCVSSSDARQSSRLTRSTCNSHAHRTQLPCLQKRCECVFVGRHSVHAPTCHARSARSIHVYVLYVGSMSAA